MPPDVSLGGWEEGDIPGLAAFCCWEGLAAHAVLPTGVRATGLSREFRARDRIARAP